MHTQVIVKDRRAEPFFFRHPWVFSGAIARIEGDAADGSIVHVRTRDGAFIGKGYINRQSQITVRLLTWREDEPIDDAFWRRHIENAVTLREQVLRVHESSNAYRLVNSEGDGTPGLIVDKYDRCLVVQFLTLGTLQRKELIRDLLADICAPASMYERGELMPAKQEGVSSQSGLLWGEGVPELVEVRENGLRFFVDVKRGQKTGAYLDQRDNRLLLSAHTQGKRVLDCFTYNGGFAIHAAALGKAERVLAIDASARAIEIAQKNADANGVDNVEWRVSRSNEAMRGLRHAGERFDVVVLDPPKFARSRGGLKNAQKGYHETNLLAMQLLEPDGLLLTCSCSQYVDDEMFSRILNEAAVEADKVLRVLRRAGQPMDHAVVASCPESRYLTAYLCHVQHA